MDDARLKRLRIRAWRRGFREMDLILGPFADQHAQSLDEAELAAFEALLLADDQDVYGWIIGREPPAPEHDTSLMKKLQAFDPSQGIDRGA
ncbi:succinate dehydrogenase assembly factor 2 [Caulobacter sp. NIBR1757]|uniref:FAD assembly factor SdhE n=1 Tax=Caulobacter sp. NIBR1757 TaxID=3016000 RepID=UPI0022F0AD05|nr:succinate dehydrogenase assembly factor 2 [Caulobacter sp. NIBR1757]